MGIAATFWGMPHIESFLDKDFDRVVGKNSNSPTIHTSNTLNSEPPNFSLPDPSGSSRIGPNEIMTAMYLTSYFVANGHGKDTAPDAVQQTITQLAQSNVAARGLLARVGTSPLSNSDALKILQGSLANS